MPGLLVTVRAPGHVQLPVDERETGPLIFMEGIKGNPPATAAPSGTRNSDGGGKRNGSAGGLAAVAEIERVEALVAIPGGSGIRADCFGLSDHVQNFCDRIDHWSSDNANVRLDVLAAH